ncbi:hypothetical protein ACJIZ3_010833 [Penstemon smallii]|uniref:Sulfotransferase n=1 Tax=Penstemon smallii TaxID=265156 RepID=A0ABD3UJ20_9LAMI
MSFSNENPYQKFTDLLSTLPNMNDLYQYQGFWYPCYILEGVLQVQQQFQALPTDIIITGWPKTGNTWLKALLKNPLLNHLPHALIPFLEIDFFKNPNMRDSHQHSILSTHMPYTSLPKTIASSGCKIIYIYLSGTKGYICFFMAFR